MDHPHAMRQRSAEKFDIIVNHDAVFRCKVMVADIRADLSAPISIIPHFRCINRSYTVLPEETQDLLNRRAARGVAFREPNPPVRRQDDLHLVLFTEMVDKSTEADRFSGFST